jgi:hypothetical protein
MAQQNTPLLIYTSFFSWRAQASVELSLLDGTLSSSEIHSICAIIQLRCAHISISDCASGKYPPVRRTL